MSIPQPRASILNIRSHMQGLPELPGRTIVKLASNESAFGPSPRAITAAHDAVGHMERYAEQGTGELQAAIGTAFDLDPDRIVCGPGSDELLTRILRAYLEPGQELIFSAHGYAKFRNYAWACGAEPVAAPDKTFRADVDRILACVTDKTRVVGLANPDNPTGTYVPDHEVRRLRENLPEQVILIADSAYAEYVDADDYGDPARLVDDYPNVIMTRTFSKIFGMAGERLGWLYAVPEVIDVMRRLGATFPISATALAAGIAAVGDREHSDYVKRENSRIRANFSNALQACGLEVVPTQTNFMLVRFPDPSRSAAGAYDYLLEQGIIARRFPGDVFAEFMRISIGLADEMDVCLQHLQRYLAR